MNIKLLNHEKWAAELDAGNINARELFQYVIKNDYKFVWHPLGFIMCKLSDEGTRKIRLHIWPGNKRKIQNPAWLIHDHLFDLKSWVLVGKIQNQEFEPLYSEPSKRIYFASYKGEKSVLERSDKTVSLVERKVEIIRAGQIYGISAGVFHKSSTVNDCTAITVCETIDKLNRKPMVIGENDGKEMYTYTRSMVTKEDLLNFIKEI